MPDRLKAARRKAVGAKQTMRALQAGLAAVVYTAGDADRRIVHSVLELTNNLGVELVEVESTVRLGRLCGIDVGAACAAIVADTAQVRHNA